MIRFFTARPAGTASVLTASALVAAAVTSVLSAGAQPFDARRALSVVAGPPHGPSPTDRVDAQRSGLSRLPLGSPPLRVAWRHGLGQSLDQAPLVMTAPDGRREIVVVAGRGDLVALDDEGVEVWRVALGSMSASSATALSDGTLVVVTTTGEAVGVRRGQVRFRTRLGANRAGGRAASLPLADGGVVVAAGHELTALDRDGLVQSSAMLPEPVAGPLVAGPDRLYAVTSSGGLYAWMPGREPTRVGSFGGPVDGGAAMADAGTLLAVVDGARLVAMDVAHGVAVTRAQSAGLALLGPPAVRAGLAHVMGHAGGRTFVLALDAAGQEKGRALVGTSAASAPADAGAPALSIPPHVGVLVDTRGSVAFATPDGRVGVVDASGATEALAETPCTRTTATPRAAASAGASTSNASSNNTSGIVGLAAGGPGFVISCDSGAIVRVTGAR